MRGYSLKGVYKVLASLVAGITNFLFFFVFLGLHPWHMEVPRLGIESELEPSAYTTATSTPDLSHICDLHQSARQPQMPDPLSKARD